MVTQVCYKVSDILNAANEDSKEEGEGAGEGPVTVQILSDYGRFGGPL